MPQRILIVGAGGHAQVVADIVLRSIDAGLGATLVGFVDERAPVPGRRILGAPVLGTVQSRNRRDYDAVVVAVGDNGARARLFHTLAADGEVFVTVCHPSAVIAPDAQLGPGCVVCARAVVGTGTTLGRNIIVNTASTIDHHNRIGDHVHIAPGVHLGGEVTVGEGALIGIGATVMPSRGVGVWSTVGAGSLVRHDVPHHVTVVGVPATTFVPQSLISR